ncbi:hypothetical protein FRC15_000933, partial [Serendipita sp. 397]
MAEMNFNSVSSRFCTHCLLAAWSVHLNALMPALPKLGLEQHWQSIWQFWASEQRKTLCRGGKMMVDMLGLVFFFLLQSSVAVPIRSTCISKLSIHHNSLIYTATAQASTFSFVLHGILFYADRRTKRRDQPQSIATIWPGV